MSVAVLTDSAADLPPVVAAEHGISVVPLIVSFAAGSFRDGLDLPPEGFWERATTEVPTTASPSPETIGAAIDEAAADGADGVVAVHVSSTLSRTVESARMAAMKAALPVEVVDSRSVSLGQGLVAVAAAEAAAVGGSFQEVARAAAAAARLVDVVAFLETVEFLKRGGRVGRARAALSDLLRIRPVLTLEDGEPTLVARARTRGRAIDEVLTRVGGAARAAGVLHAGAPESTAVAEEVAERCGVAPLVSLVGAVTGTHLGPGALGVAVLRLD